MEKDNNNNNTNNAFFSSGEYGCAMYPRIRCDGKISKSKKKLISKISIDDFYTNNEYEISQIIKNIKDNKNRFLYITNKCYIKKKNITEYKKKDCKVLEQYSKQSKYVLLYSRYKKTTQIGKLFNESFSYKLLFAFYNFMLESIQLLCDNKIVHKDLHFGNVLIDPKINKFYIIDFGLSITENNIYTDINKTKLNYYYLEKVLMSFYPSWDRWSIEYHILCFFVYKKTKLTQNDLNFIIDEYYQKNFVFNNLFPDINKYKKTVFNFYKKKFINNISIDTHISDILINSMYTWDIYHLNYIVLYTIYSDKLENELNSFIDLCTEGLHYNYSLRPSCLHFSKQMLFILKQYIRNNTFKLLLDHKVNHDTRLDTAIHI